MEERDALTEMKERYVASTVIEDGEDTKIRQADLAGLAVEKKSLLSNSSSSESKDLQTVKEEEEDELPLDDYGF